jgi:hypothetical protein
MPCGRSCIFLEYLPPHTNTECYTVKLWFHSTSIVHLAVLFVPLLNNRETGSAVFAVIHWCPLRNMPHELLGRLDPVQAMKACRGKRCIAAVILDLVLDV